VQTLPQVFSFVGTHSSSGEENGGATERHHHVGVRSRALPSAQQRGWSRGGGLAKGASRGHCGSILNFCPLRTWPRPDLYADQISRLACFLAFLVTAEALLSKDHGVLGGFVVVAASILQHVVDLSTELWIDLISASRL